MIPARSNSGSAAAASWPVRILSRDPAALYFGKDITASSWPAATVNDVKYGTDLAIAGGGSTPTIVSGPDTAIHTELISAANSSAPGGKYYVGPDVNYLAIPASTTVIYEAVFSQFLASGLSAIFGKWHGVVEAWGFYGYSSRVQINRAGYNRYSPAAVNLATVAYNRFDHWLTIDDASTKVQTFRNGASVSLSNSSLASMTTAGGIFNLMQLSGIAPAGDFQGKFSMFGIHLGATVGAQAGWAAVAANRFNELFTGVPTNG